MTDLAIMNRGRKVFPPEFRPVRDFVGPRPEAAPTRRPEPGTAQVSGTPMAAEIILVFASNTEVLNVEDLLEGLDLDFELVPVPKEVNPNCGLAISFQEPARPAIMAALHQAGFKPASAYERRGDDFRPWPDDGGHGCQADSAPAPS